MRLHRPFSSRLVAVLLTGLLASGVAHAQAGGDLPLVSVGDALKWEPAQESYLLRVPAGSTTTPVNIEVFSPGLNLGDYADGRATAGYYGDELYARDGQFETTFTLVGPDGVVVERRYQATREHAWESLYSGTLPAGSYTLRVSSKGNGKNAFALRAASPFSFEATDYTVNARGRPGEELVSARISVPRDWVGKTVELVNYDGDGLEEIGLTVVLPGGQRRNLTVSGNNTATTDAQQVTADLVGEWTVLASVPVTARQYSNAFTLRTFVDKQPAPARLPSFTPPAGRALSNVVLVETVDAQGRAIPGATFALGADGVVRSKLPAGFVSVSAAVVEGRGAVGGAAEVRLEPGSARVRFVARAQEGGLAVEAVAVWGNQRIALTGVPVDVAGRTVTVPGTVTLPPGDYAVRPAVVPGATAQAVTGRVTDGGTGRVTVEYQVRADVSLLASPDLVDACDVTQLTATARTDFPYRLTTGLRLNLPNGWTSDYPLEARGELSAATPLRLKVPVRVCRGDVAEVSMETVGLVASGEARVRNPAGANVTRVAQGGARVRLAKSAVQVQNGFVITLILNVDAVVENLRVLDPLPAGGSSPALRGPLTLDGPSLANVSPRLDGDTIVLGRVTPGQYTLSYTLFTDVSSDRVVTPPDLTW